MRTPMRIIPDAPAEYHADDHPVVDLRTGWQKNAKAVGTVIGTALSVFLVGTGGLTGLAHVAGIALSKDLEPLKTDVAAIVAAQQKAPTATTISEAIKTAHTLDNERLDAMAKSIKGLRVDFARKYKRKPEPQAGDHE